MLQKCFIHGPVVAGVAGGLQAAAAPTDDGLAASIIPVDAPVKLAAENDLCETVLREESTRSTFYVRSDSK